MRHAVSHHDQELEIRDERFHGGHETTSPADSLARRDRPHLRSRPLRQARLAAGMEKRLKVICGDDQARVPRREHRLCQMFQRGRRVEEKRRVVISSRLEGRAREPSRRVDKLRTEVGAGVAC